MLALALVLLGYVGLLVTLFPYAIPQTMTIWEAAAPFEPDLHAGRRSGYPPIIIATTMGYWVFRGKVRHEDQHYYHH